MGQDDVFQAVKLPFSPQDYLCTWNLPDVRSESRNDGNSRCDGDESGTVELNGTLDLTTGHDPRGSFYGKLPIIFKNGGTRFPQISSFDRLTGRLSTGAYFVLINGQHNYWYLDHGYANGVFAIVSGKPFKKDAHRTYRSIELQLEGLDRIIDVSPTETQFDEEKSSFSIAFNKTCWEWHRGNVSMRLYFVGRSRRDPYNFVMSFAPVLRIDAGSPLTVVDWWTNWIIPLQEFIASAIGQTPDIMYMLAIAEHNSKREQKDQIFRWDIKQESLYHSTDTTRRSEPAIKIQEDSINLLALLIEYQKLLASHHPLIETFQSVALSSDQHPRSRFLLLIQALEGLHGSEHREEEDKQCQAYKKKKEEVLDHLKKLDHTKENEVITKNDCKFLKENLMSGPFVTLESRLIAIFDTLPSGVREKLGKNALIRQFQESQQKPNMRMEAALASMRNKLSHGAISFEPNDLNDVVEILYRVVRAELLRVLGAPEACRMRLLKDAES
jgi:hypothetical protein